MNYFFIKTRYCIAAFLVFSFMIISCKEKDGNTNAVSIIWEKEKPTGISIPKEMAAGIPADSFQTYIRVHLLNTTTPVLGEYEEATGEIIFRPLLAFTRGLKYQVTVRNKTIAEIEVPRSNDTAVAEVVAIYPGADTVPGNLLKIYILFSKAMQEGEALQHISLVKNETDTVSSAFLDMQPELWNKERTVLTVWFDPGRIKRDLIPNKTLGTPLQGQEIYQLRIRHNWQDASGSLLKQDYTKNFFTTYRDSISPDINKWIIRAPAAGSMEKLEIHFNESLDHILALNAIQIKTSDRNIVNGSFTLNKQGNILSFNPGKAWEKQTYIIEAESRLEDLAGNNLNRLFDTDLTQKQKPPKDIYKRSFEVK